jgi:K+-sensing histidine kinase KdpD
VSGRSTDKEKVKLTTSNSGDRSLTAITLIVAAVVSVFGVVFAQSDQVDRVAEQATEVRRTEQAVSAIIQFRANLGISLVLASADSTGLAVEDSPAEAVEQSRKSLTQVEEAVSEIGNSNDAETLMSVAVVAERVLAMIESGRIDEGNDLARARLLPLLLDLEKSLDTRAEQAAQAIAVEGSTAGDAARATSLAVALIVPAMAVLAMRRSLRKRAEKQLLEVELETEREQSRERDELIASLSHQIRTPLSGVYGFAEAMSDLLESGLADEDFLKEAAATIFSQSFEIRRLIDDLFVAARNNSGILEKAIVDVDVARAAATAVEPFAKSGFEAAIDVEPGSVLADNLRLQHILRNLLHNAASHGGRNIALVGRAQETSYQLMVVDDGAGLADGSPASRFTPFIHRGDTSATSGSLGLGLSVARSLAELMNGTLIYERRNGKSWFVLTLERPAGYSRETAAQVNSR